MDNSVKVTGHKVTGGVVTPSTNNPEYGYVRVEQTRAVFKDGWGRKETVSAIISGKVEELSSFGWVVGQSLPGRIQVKESVEAFNDVNPEKDLKMGGNTGIVCMSGDSPVYRKTFYTGTSEVEDTFVSHDNGDEISAAHAAQKEAAKLAPNAEFDLENKPALGD